MAIHDIFNFRSDRAREISRSDCTIPDTMLITFIPYGFSRDSGMAQSTTPAFEFERCSMDYRSV